MTILNKRSRPVIEPGPPRLDKASTLEKRYSISVLKGQCHEIFDFRLTPVVHLELRISPKNFGKKSK
jgi:hypothetical protein